MEKTHFSATEVGTLIESFRSELRIIAEAVVSLQKKVDDMSERLTSLENRVNSMEDVIRIAIPDLYSRVYKLAPRQFNSQGYSALYASKIEIAN